jgi:hypothetical protein
MQPCILRPLMKTIILAFSFLAFACSNNKPAENAAKASDSVTKTETAKEAKASGKGQHWEGAFTNGMKQTFISFDISEDGTKLQNLTFNGYWYCDGKLTQDILGPEESFHIKDEAVDGVIVDKTSYTRFELKAKLGEEKAEGTFRMSITGLGCDTRVLTWTAAPKN